MTATWSQVSGPGTATFSNSSSATSDVTFDTDGTYVLRLTADDSALQHTDDVSVTVNASTVNAWAGTGGTVQDASWGGDTVPITGDQNVGELAGDGGVSGSSATYNIPINVVPGRAGVQPDVSLSYSSDGGNGIAGVGWQLSAGGAIARCPKTPAQDGVTDKVNFLKATDRLCLNGQRLVAISGTYGNSGTEYRTELDRFVKVVQSGDMDGTTTSFTVTYKDGVTEHFGQTADSRHSLDGITQTLSVEHQQVARSQRQQYG